ncbi:MAG: hypothetical protein NVV63_02355 [Opitutus sp.]|nr:hypothetical protein [Opitutus sp.]
MADYLKKLSVGVLLFALVCGGVGYGAAYLAFRMEDKERQRESLDLHAAVEMQRLVRRYNATHSEPLDTSSVDSVVTQLVGAGGFDGNVWEYVTFNPDRFVIVGGDLVIDARWVVEEFGRAKSK